MKDAPVMEKPPGRENQRLFSNRPVSGGMPVYIEKDMGALTAATIIKRRRIDALRISELTIQASEALENLATGFTGRKAVTTSNKAREQIGEKTI
jgi:hypothetical protein